MEIGSYIGSSASLNARNSYRTNIICIDPCNLPLHTMVELSIREKH